MSDEQVAQLSAAFREAFGGEVEVEPVGRPGRFRFAISSPNFEPMTQLARQDALWRIVDRILPRDATLDVAMILAFAPSEFEKIED